MNKAKIIAIDGPAGSGKSTVARRVAEKLKFLYIDTGAMYRALTLKVMRKGLNFDDKQKIIDLSQNADISLRKNNGSLKVYLDREDVTEAIRTMEVTSKVKFIASLGAVRENMVRLQRELGYSSSGAVLEGRDIGTVVFPEAAYKFYLDADFKVRVGRRFAELREKSFNVSLDEIQDDLKARDTSDKTREVGPLKKAQDAMLIDTTDMTIDEVVNEILRTVRQK